MKKSFISFLVFALVLSISVVALAVTYSDIKGHWAESSIERWTNEKVIKGYSDGTFRPDEAITRSEFITMIMRIFEPEKEADLKSFKDADENAWYYEAIAKAVAMNAVEGYPATTVEPNANITRQEAVVILNRIIELKASKQASLDKFSDADQVGSWAKDALLAFEERGYVIGYEDGSLRPQRNITRAEAVKLLDKVVSLIVTKSGKYDLSGENGIVVVKRENVTLENTDDVARIFALNNGVRDTLKPTLDDKDIINPSEKKEERTSGGGGSSTRQEELKITLTSQPNGDAFDVEKEGNVKDGVKLIVVVDGEEIINDTFSSSKFSALKEKVLNFIIENKKTRADDAERLIRTAYEQYYLTDKKEAAVGIIDELAVKSDITSAERAKITALRLEYEAGKSARQIYRENINVSNYKSRLLRAYDEIDYKWAKKFLELIYTSEG